MRGNITAFTDPAPAADGKLTPFVSVNVEDDGSTSVTARDAEGVTVKVSVPNREWLRMAREIFSARCTGAA
jgi:hypothetical protein